MGARLTKEQLLTDLTSTKVGPVQAMLQSDACVIGSHPVFGPMPSAAGQTVVLCPARPGGFLPELRELWECLGCSVVEMTAARHDELMGVIQGLSHFINIAFADTLRRMQIAPQDLLEVCSPNYRIAFAVLSRIMSGSPQLYSQIQTHNASVPPACAAFVEAASELETSVRAQDTQAIASVFEAAAEFLGDYRQIAKAESDKLIQAVSRKS